VNLRLKAGFSVRYILKATTKDIVQLNSEIIQVIPTRVANWFYLIQSMRFIIFGPEISIWIGPTNFTPLP
jgi:hypothetical protein